MELLIVMLCYVWPVGAAAAVVVGDLTFLFYILHFFLQQSNKCLNTVENCIGTEQRC